MSVGKVTSFNSLLTYKCQSVQWQVSPHSVVPPWSPQWDPGHSMAVSAHQLSGPLWMTLSCLQGPTWHSQEDLNIINNRIFNLYFFQHLTFTLGGLLGLGKHYHMQTFPKKNCFFLSVVGSTQLYFLSVLLLIWVQGLSTNYFMQIFLTIWLSRT